MTPLLIVSHGDSKLDVYGRLQHVSIRETNKIIAHTSTGRLGSPGPGEDLDAAVELFLGLGCLHPDGCSL